MSGGEATGAEDAAILLMSLGEEEAAAVFRHLTPKEVQTLGETIARMKSIPRERVDSVIERFSALAADQSMLVPDNDAYVKAVLRRALGDEKAAILIDRILENGDISGIESLKWMDAAVGGRTAAQRAPADRCRDPGPPRRRPCRRRCSRPSPSASATRC